MLDYICFTNNETGTIIGGHVSKNINSGYFAQGSFYNAYYKIIDYKVVIIASCSAYTNPFITPYVTQFEVDGKPVSKDVYDAEYAKYNTKDYSPIVRKYDITADNIAKVIDEYTK